MADQFREVSGRTIQSVEAAVDIVELIMAEDGLMIAEMEDETDLRTGRSGSRNWPVKRARRRDSSSPR